MPYLVKALNTGTLQDFSNWVRQKSSNPYIAILTVIVLLFLVPTLCGYPTWPGSPTTSPLIKLDNAWDRLTFGADHRPIREFIATEIWSGRFPTWIQTSILGLPLLEQYEYQILNPLEWLTYFGADVWWTVVLCSYLFVGGMGIFKICRSFGTGKIPAVGGAIAYTAAGHVPLFYTVPSWAVVIPIIPWMLYFAAKLITSPLRSGHFVGLWISVTLLLLSGQPQIILCTVYFFSAFIGLLIILQATTTKQYKRILTGAFAALCAAILALPAAAPQIVPFTKFVLYGDAFTGHAFSLSGWRISAVNLINLMFPFSMGTTPYANWTVDTLIRKSPSEDFPISFYCTGTFLALVGIAAAFRRNADRATLIAYSVATLFTLSTIAAYGLLHWRVWAFEFVHLARYSCPILAALLSIMIAIGIDALKKPSKAEIYFAASIVGVGIATLGTIFALHLRAKSIASFAVLEHVLVLGTVTFLLEFAVFLIAVRHNSRTSLAVLLLFVADAAFQIRYGFELSVDIYRTIPLVILAIGALFYHSRNWSPVFAAGIWAFLLAAGWIYYGETQTTKVAEPEIPSPKLTYGHRVASSIEAYSADFNTAQGVIALASRNPITFNRLQEFLFSAGSDLPVSSPPLTVTVRDWRGFTDADNNPDQSLISWKNYCLYRHRFNILAADILIGYRGGTIDAIKSYRGCENGIEPYDLGNQRFSGFRDTHAAPRAYFTTSCSIQSGNPISYIRNNWADIIERPVIEGAPQTAPCADQQPASIKPLNITEITSENLEIDTSTLPGGLVVLNDQYFYAWSAYVDRIKTDIVRVNSNMRGVIIPSGSRLVRFVYEPRLKLAWLVSFLSLVGVLLFAWLINNRHPRRLSARIATKLSVVASGRGREFMKPHSHSPPFSG